MDTTDVRKWVRSVRESIPIWLWLSIEAIVVLVVILIPSLFLSSLEAGLISAIGTGLASTVLVLLVVVALVPILFGGAFVIKWVVGNLRDAVSRG